MTRPCKCRSNTVIRFSVSNTLNQNTVFAIFAKHTKSKHGVWIITQYNQWLIFTDAGLWGTHRAQHCKYTAQQYANIGWFGSQNWSEPACCDSQLLTLFKMHRDTNAAKTLYAKWEHSSCRRHQFNSNTVFAITVLTLHFRTQCSDYYILKTTY